MTGEGQRVYDLEDRMVEFAALIIDLGRALPNTREGNHIAGQLLRSGTAPAANYGEAQGAESRKDFIHKLKICLKELRETRIWLRIIDRIHLASDDEHIGRADAECNELIAILVASIGTAKRNQQSKSSSRPS